MVDFSAYSRKAVVSSFLRRTAAEREALDALTRSFKMIKVGPGRSKDGVLKLELDRTGIRRENDV
ncbi:MAG: hypothetical protein ACE5KH_03415 [Candidatus Geothermarchaeales archaeon]